MVRLNNEVILKEMCEIILNRVKPTSVYTHANRKKSKSGSH